MAETRPLRRLAAILVADVVGYSRFMEADEVAALAALRQLRNEVVEPLVEEHSGRITDLFPVRRSEDVARLAEGLRKARLPDN